ncbi:MAG: hypothetical protein KAR20_29610, partial [Candidatus Heimdallarchaeota archaeon]|nr:hypothetical protein [Candidatus Heimdallarchaeota archaeon]
MNVRRLSFNFIIGVIVVFTASGAFPNNLDPPRPRHGAPITAICKEKSSDRQHEIFSVQVKIGDNSLKAFIFQIDSASEKIAISNIKSLSLNTSGVDHDGFIKATLVRADGSEEKSAMVQVRLTNENVELVGFKRDGTRIKIELLKCTLIKFFSATMGDSEMRQRDEIEE